MLRFDDDGAAISESFLAPDSHEYPVNARFEGEEAEALQAWIAKQAKEITKTVGSVKAKEPTVFDQQMESLRPQRDNHDA